MDIYKQACGSRSDVLPPYPSQIFLQGLVNLNRAVHEDIVAVEILPKKQWTCPSSIVTTTLPTGDDDDDDASDDDSNLMVYI